MSTCAHTTAYDTRLLPVGDIHKIHYAQYGNPNGKSAIYLHGGPGGDTSIANTVFFDPAAYRVVLLDQRGCGESTPTCELRENSSEYLVSDIEALREHLGIDKWHVAYPDRVRSLVLRGIFLVRKSEVDWGRWIDPKDGGAAHLFPEAYDEFLEYFTNAEKKEWKHSADWEDLMLQRLTSSDKAVQQKAARVFNTLDFKCSNLFFNPKSMEKLDNEKYSLHHATLELYYLMNGSFIREGQILEESEMQKIRHIPCTIIHGRYDAVCPVVSAWDLHKAWPEAKLIIIPDAGHGATEPGTLKELIKACDEYAKL